MLLIGICDADSAARSLLTDYLRRYERENTVTIHTIAFDSSETLLKNYMLQVDVLFLEIPFGKKDGLETARKLRQKDPGVRLILMAAVMNFVLEAYEVGASNYFLKPLKYNKFCKEMDRAIHLDPGEKYLLEHTKNGIYRILWRQIRYVETVGRKILIHMENECITSTCGMKVMEEKLYGEEFIRCHTGYLVNLRYFERLEGMELKLCSGIWIPVSRSRKKAVSERIEQLYGVSEWREEKKRK